jgi:Carboxypeptidase regulatory-like domain
MKQSITRPADRHLHGTSWWLGVSLLLIFGVFGVHTGNAQTTNATITGHITDPTGALVSGATVTLTDMDTQIVTKTTANDQGLYVFPSVKPGNYTLGVSHQGFRATTVSGLTADVQASISRDVALEPGATSETVTVVASEGDTMVERTSSELGTEIEEKQIHDLPLNGRNFTQLLTLTPGASPVMTSQASQVGVNDQAVLSLPGSSFNLPSLQGQITRENVYLLDGVVNTDFTNGVYVIPPIIDALQEFKVQSHDDKAEFGGVLGGVVNVVTRSGTNQLHGSGWEFVRNNIFDARDSFADRPVNGVAPGPSEFRQNQFGATVGGPVWLPHVYNGRNRTFFFFGYERWKYTQGGNHFFNLPTPAELSGDFSHSTLANNIFDPTTTVATSNGYTRKQFDYNGTANVINPALINQTIVNFLKTYDTGTPVTGVPGYNASYKSPRTDDSNHYMFRLDEQLGSKDILFFRYDQLNVVDVTPNSATQSTSSTVDAKDLAAGWTHVFTQKLLFDVRFGFATRPFNRGPATDSNGLGPLQALGFTAPGGTILGLGAPYTAPGIQSGYGSWAPNTITNPVYSYTPTLTWVLGAHNIKFGMQYLNQGSQTHQPAYGNFPFSNTQTADPNNLGTTGNSLASALLGYPASNSNTPDTTQGNRVSSYAAYAQDVWTVNQKITVTYGLRIDHRRPFAPKEGTFVSSPNTDGVWWIGMKSLPASCAVAGQQPCIPSATGALDGIDNGVAAVNPDTGLPWYNAASPPIQLSPYGTAWGATGGWDAGPRVGIAWRLDSKTTIRGGYGFVYDANQGIEQDWKANEGQWPANGAVGGSIALNQTGGPLTQFQSSVTTVAKVLPAADPWSLGSWYTDPHIQDPRSQQYDVLIDREIGSKTGLSIGYVGSKDDRLAVTGQWNTAKTPGLGTISQVRARTPFPWYNTSSFYSTSQGTSTYNALQVKLDHKFSNGLQYLVSYTYSKTLGTGGSGLFGVENGPGGYSVWQNYYDLKASKAALAFNVPQILAMTGQYALPFGIHQRYLNHGVAAYVLGNWEANTNIQIRSGQPYNFDVSGDIANIEAPAGDSWFTYERPNVVGNPKLSHPTKLEAFNTAAFQVPAAGTYGNAGTSLLYSSHYADADISLFKNIPIKDQLSMTLRADIFNAFNIQNYGVPDSNISDGQGLFGVISSTVSQNPRQIQLSARLSF